MQQDITSRLPVSNPTDLATGPEIAKHQFHHLLLQGPQGSQDLSNQGSCQTLTRDNVIENFEDDSCFSCEKDLFNVSDIEEHQPPTTPEPCLKRYSTVKNRLSERIDFWESTGASNWIPKILRLVMLAFCEAAP